MRTTYILPLSLAAAFTGMTLLNAMDTQERKTCLQETTIKIAGREQTITLRDAEQIKQTVERYLAEKKPKLEPSVFGPGEVFIDCEGVVRMGAWLLESSSLSGEGPSLSFRVVTNENFIVRQLIGLKQMEGGWEVTGVSRSTAHRRY